MRYIIRTRVYIMAARVRFERLFRQACAQRRSAVIGMVHVQALPGTWSRLRNSWMLIHSCACALLNKGTPKSGLEVVELVDQAVREARLYRECGLDGVVVENMHDTPYVSEVGPEVTATMTRVCGEVRQAIGGDLPLGVQILSGKPPSLSLPH